MFEILEHTADIGFRARAGTLPELFEAAALALVAVALEPEDIQPRTPHDIDASGEDTESLLVNWLNEVLFLLDAERLALARFHIERFEENRVAGQAFGEPFDPARHHARLIVKGVTYHQLRIWQDEQGWGAEVYLDI